LKTQNLSERGKEEKEKQREIEDSEVYQTMKATTSTTAAYLIFVDSQNIEREQYQLKHGENRIGT